MNQITTGFHTKESIRIYIPELRIHEIRELVGRKNLLERAFGRL